MRKLKRTLILIILVLGLGVAYQETRYYPLYSFTAKSFGDLNQKVQAWPKIELATLATQDVNAYGSNLNSQIKLIETQIAAINAYQAMLATPKPSLWSQPLTVVHISPALVSELKQVGIPEENLNQPALEAHLEEVKSALGQMRRRYYVDKTFLNYAAADWIVLHGNLEFKSSLDLATKFLGQAKYAYRAEGQGIDILPEESELNGDSETIPEPVFVRAGDIIGTQGCSGLCTGTHLHFVAFKDNALIDPCALLPLREFIRWGAAASCGVSADTASLSWPLPFAWMISQTFAEFSPLVNDTHGALDLLDRWWGPVVAAHDGYLYTEKRSCRFAYICNDGVANVVTICTEKDCDATRLRTEYWHLDWMLNEPLKYQRERP